MSTTTPLMDLVLPTPTVTLGPEYAVENNDAFEVIDGHDHTSGKGKPVPTSGLDINADLNFNESKAYALLSTQFDDQSAALSGALNAGSVYTVNGNLYFTNGSGTAVQLTDGGSPITVPSSASSFEYTTTAGDLTIAPSDTFVAISVDTTASRTITLPLAAAVAAGRIYNIKDGNGLALTNPITIARQGSDTIDEATSLTMSSGDGSVMLIGNGVNTWEVI